MHDSATRVPEGRAETEEGRVTHKEIHSLVEELVDLLTRPGVDHNELERDRAIEILKILRAERLKHDPQYKALGQAQECADAEGYVWDSLPEATRETFIREVVETDWLERGFRTGLSPFPADGDDSR